MTFDAIYFVGDTHGEWHRITDTIEKFEISNSAIIHVGDVGIGFESFVNQQYTLSLVNDFLSKNNNHIFLIRGNHDDPKYFNGTYYLNMSHITFIKDYTTLTINDIIFLFIGGALSIDRKERKEGVSYWKDEGFVLDENILNNLRDINIVVTHSSPEFTMPLSFNNLVHYYAKYDSTLLSELTHERRLITKAFEIIKQNNKILKYIYGHFHFSHKEIIDDTEFILLNCGEFYQLPIIKQNK